MGETQPLPLKDLQLSGAGEEGCLMQEVNTRGLKRSQYKG